MILPNNPLYAMVQALITKHQSLERERDTLLYGPSGSPGPAGMCGAVTVQSLYARAKSLRQRIADLQVEIEDLKRPQPDLEREIRDIARELGVANETLIE